MPTAAVRAAGRPTVSAGSAMTIFGSIRGWKMILFSCASTSLITLARPTSEPVPAVVGTAITGRILAGSASLKLSPTSSNAQSGRSCRVAKAMALPASSEEPPPKAITPSPPCARSAAPPRATSSPVGSLAMSLKRATSIPSPASAARASAIIGLRASPRSVTSRGRAIPTVRQASASSLIRPAPKRMDVG